uniref:Uncharacterized protein n=1 Tax=Anopheles dirus TaxID=7168 RepID=A0A182MZE1_9DIPT
MHPTGRQLRPPVERLLPQQLLPLQPLGLELSLSTHGPVPEMGMSAERARTLKAPFALVLPRNIYVSLFESFSKYYVTSLHRARKVVVLFKLS